MLQLALCVLLMATVYAEDDPYPDWQDLSVTFKKYNGLPSWEHEAIADGWTIMADGCKDTSLFFLGKQYVKTDATTILLFDQFGQIAGMQFSATNKTKAAKNRLTNPFYEHNGMLYLTAYFTELTNICSTTKVRDARVVGNKLLVQTSSNHDVMEIPLSEGDVLAKTDFKKGRCFWGMGQHYWYDISNNMDCEDFYPVFLLYNGGKLNAFGWATAGFVESPRVEHPPNSKFLLGNFFFPKDKFPKCLIEPDNVERKLTTQHIYLQKRPYLNFC